VFFPGSRYANTGTYQVTLPDGSTVAAARSPLPAPGTLIGWYKRSANERLDLLASNYLGDPTQAWGLGWTNDAMTLDALAAHEYIAVPSATPAASADSATATG
jgi:hypothetical protein